MAQLAAAESLAAIVGPSLASLFTPTPGEVQRAIGHLATSKQFSNLARDFFARLIRRHLEYYLSRELPNHIGPAHRFASIADHSAFNADLDQHCREASRIIQDFAAGWFGKTNYYEGGITREKAHSFLIVALKKIRRELQETGCRLSILSSVAGSPQRRWAGRR
jgi:hypothetical protein